MTPLSFATLMTSPLKACLPDGSTGRGAKTGIYYIFAKPDDLPTAKLQDSRNEVTQFREAEARLQDHVARMAGPSVKKQPGGLF